MSVRARGGIPTALTIMLALMAATIVVIAPTGKAAASGTPASGDVVPNELLVGFADGTTGASQRALVAQAGGELTDRLPALDGAVVEAGDPADVAQRLRDRSQVAYVEPNYVMRTSKIPNDNGFEEQWALRNSGQLGGQAGADIGATAAWDVTTGNGVTMAVVDTGVDYQHPDLDGNIWHNPVRSSTESTTTTTATSTTRTAWTSSTTTPTPTTTPGTAPTSAASSPRRATTAAAPWVSTGTRS